VRERSRRRDAFVSAALFGAFWCAACTGRTPPAQAPFDAVVLITIDTLRADRLGAYGHRAPTTPVLDALAAESVLFEHAAATCPATAPSVAAILTGHHRAVHGVERNTSRLRADVSTLAEILRRAGHRTVAVVANPVLNRRGFEQGFERFDLAATDPRRRALGADIGVAKLAGRALRTLRDERFFLWVHFMSPHGPYRPPPDQAKRFRPAHYWRFGDRQLPFLAGNYGLGGIPFYQRLFGSRAPARYRARYDAEVRYADILIGLLLRRLQRLGRWDHTLLVVTADHGESLGEHDAWFQHGWYAYDATVRIPLLVRAPGRLTPARVSSSVSLLDVTPTILDLLDLPPRPHCEGQSLLPVIEGPASDRPAFTQTYYANRLTALTLGSWKYIRAGAATALPRGTTARAIVPRPPPAPEQLYDLAADPQETTNLAAQRPAVSALLAERTGAWLRRQARRAQRRPPAPRPRGEATGVEAQRFRERLRALGYAD